MFDLKRTVNLVTGAVLSPSATWDDYLAEASNWQNTAALITGPLVVVCFILGYIVSALIGWFTPSLISLIAQIILAFASAGIIAWIFAFMAGIFNGQRDFAKALAATQLAFVPGYLAQIVIPIPLLGWLFGLALGIYGLVLLWRVLPTYLSIPEPDRIKHYISSLALSFVVMLAIGMIFGGSIAARNIQSNRLAGTDQDGSPSTVSAGPFAGLERRSDLIEAAESDIYEPPANGRISEVQMTSYLRVLSRTHELRTAQTRRLKELSDRAEKGNVDSLGDVFSGIGNAMDVATAEMEVVKTSGGNWAEHQWIKEQLRVAQVQKDLNDAVKHNYALFLKHEQALQDAGQW